MTRRVLPFLVVLLLTAMAGWRLIVKAIHGRAVQHLALGPGMSVLDIGCGPGRLSVRIARAVGPTGRVVGIDVEPRAVRVAERRAKMAGLRNAHFVPLAFGDGSFSDGGFDRAVLVAVLGEIHDRHAAMAAIYHALKPGGILAVTECVLDPHRRRPDDVRELAALAGLAGQGYFADPLSFTITFRKPF